MFPASQAWLLQAMKTKTIESGCSVYKHVAPNGALVFRGCTL